MQKKTQGIHKTKPELSPSQPLLGSKAPLIIASLIFIYITFFFIISLTKYIYFSYTDFDLAIYNQTLWTTLHGQFLNSSIARGIIFTDHFSPVLIIYLIFYAIAPHPLTVLFLQSALLGLGAWPLYLIAKEKTNKTLGIIIVFLYLIYPALNYANLFEFHPEVALPLLILFMFYCLIKERFVQFIFLSIIALSCKEDASLVVGMFGIYAFFSKKKWHWVIWPIVSALIWAAATLLFIIPYFNKDEYIFTSFYNYLGNNPSEIIYNIIAHPLEIFKILTMPHKIEYLKSLFGPVSFLPILSPTVMLISLPTLARNLLADYFPACSIYNQYNLGITPIIFISTIYGIKHLLSLNATKKIWLLLGFSFLAISLFFAIPIGPWQNLIQTIPSRINNPFVPVMDDMVKSIPRNAGVVATFRFLPKLSGRKQLQSFHHVYLGHYNIINKKYALPAEVEYALIDFEDPLTQQFKTPEGASNFRNFLDKGSWGAVELIENLTLLKKNYPSEIKFYEILNKANPSHSVNFGINQEIALIGYDTNKDFLSNNYLGISLYWEAIKETPLTYGIVIWLEDNTGKIVRESIFSLGYNILPTEEWLPAQIIKTNHHVFLPLPLKKGNYKIKFGFFNKNNKPISISYNDEKSIDLEKKLILGDLQI